MSDIGKENYSLKQYFESIVEEPLERFKILTAWSDGDKVEFKRLLHELKKPFNSDKETTKAKGDRLENLVAFIIKKSYFFEVYKNVTTGTNEIDDVIIFSERGKQALKGLGISRDIIGIDTDIILGECKNYASSLNVTYVGKFYSLLVTTDTTFGIIFTRNGLTGNEEEYHDAYGLIKVLRIIEKYKNNREFYIIDFTFEDYEKLLEGETFFDIIAAKKLSLQIASSYESFLKDNLHENEEEIKNIIQNVGK